MTIKLIISLNAPETEIQTQDLSVLSLDEIVKNIDHDAYALVVKNVPSELELAITRYIFKFIEIQDLKDELLDLEDEIKTFYKDN